MTDHLQQVLLRLWQDSRGLSALEYAFIGGIIVAVVLVGFQALATAMFNEFSNIGR